MSDDHMTQSDVDFAVFLATVKPYKVARERPVESIQRALVRQYDRVTENKLALIRGLMLKEEKRA